MAPDGDDMGDASRTIGRAAGTAVSAVASLILHGAALAAVAYWVEWTPGAIPAPTEAVSIELLETEMLEAVETAVATASMASLESVQSMPGAATESAAVSTRAPPDLMPVAPERIDAKEATVAVTETAEGMEALKGALESDVPVGVERPADTPAAEPPPKPAQEANERKKPVKVSKLPDPSEPRKTDGDARKKGGASSRAAKSTVGATGRVSASTGSAVNYAALVRARVAARKPAGGGRRGTVVVAFAVTRAGAMSSASIARSSGDPALDRSVLAAVRGAGPFPVPPPGVNLRFSIPFYFR